MSDETVYVFIALTAVKFSTPGAGKDPLFSVHSGENVTVGLRQPTDQTCHSTSRKQTSGAVRKRRCVGLNLPGIDQRLFNF